MPAEISNRSLVRRVLSDPQTFATTMIVALVDNYGTELFQWAPQTIRLETEDDYGFKWPDINFDRLMGGIILVTTNRFYKSLPDFIELSNVLSGTGASPNVFDPAEADECAWGITEALLLAPPDANDNNPFNEEIRAYIGKVLDMEGIIVPPDILRLAVRDKDLKTSVHNDWSDDPTMYGAIWESEASKTEDINDLIKGRLMLLVNQLAALTLVNGETTEIAKKMLTQLNSKPQGGEPLI